jgi:signal transduction histidine kinase/ligand-binding sensor domain-containing protein
MWALTKLIARSLLAAVATIVLCHGSTLASQPYRPESPDPVLEKWRWRSYAELRGLGLRCMAEDKDGKMWFGVDEGVRCYDGRIWRDYTAEDGLPGDQVRALCATRDGAIYAGSVLGLCRFRNGVWERIFPVDRDLPVFVEDIVEAVDGTVWAGTGWGVLRLDADGTVLLTTADMAMALHQLGVGVRATLLPDRAVPVCPWDRPVSWLSGYGIGLWTVGETVAAVAPGGPAERAGLKVGERIRLAGNFNEMWRPQGDSVELDVRPAGHPGWRPVEVQTEHVEGNFRQLHVSEILEDREGVMWFALVWGQVARYDGRVGHPGDPAAWQLHDSSNGLEISTYPQLVEMQDGSLLAGCRWGSDLRRLDRSVGVTAWSSFGRPSRRGGEDRISATVRTSDGTIWIGTVSGLLHAWRNGQWTVYRSPDVPLPSWRVDDLVEASDGALWVLGQGQEALRLDYGTPRWTTHEGLRFQCEAADRSNWFLASDRGVVRQLSLADQVEESERWIRYGPEDGLMDRPATVIATKAGGLWAAGKHGALPASAWFDGALWHMTVHPELGETADAAADPGAFLGATDGSIWFGAGGYAGSGRGRGGVLQLRLGSGQAGRHLDWEHHRPPVVPRKSISGIVETGSGEIWVVARRNVSRYDGQAWLAIAAPEELLWSFITSAHATPTGSVWIGTRMAGLYHHRDGAWFRYGAKDGLADDHITSIVDADGGGIFAGTPRGISRFDGQAWLKHAIPSGLPPVSRLGLRRSLDGAVWINSRSTSGKLCTIRMMPDGAPPETRLALSSSEVPSGGDVSPSWQGVDPWNVTPADRLQYAWRVDGGAWSAFSTARSTVLAGISKGEHLIEVRARDLDFNVDPSPAQASFVVLPPMWQNPWFLGLMAILSGAILLQTGRTLRRGRSLRKSNEALKAEVAQRIQVERERSQLDISLQELRYLYHLRSALSEARTATEVVEKAGAVLGGFLSRANVGSVELAFDAKEWRFGASGGAGTCYERPLAPGGRARGVLKLHTSQELTESQERALLDETVEQIVRKIEVRDLEMQMLQSSRLVSLGEMAAGVAHELNQPLTVVSTTAGDIYHRLTSGGEVSREEMREMMQDILEVVGRMDETIDHLRIFSRDASEQPPAAVDVNEVVLSSLRLMTAQLESHGIAMTLELGRGLPSFLGHAHAIEQVLLNLLSNARDALDEKEASGQPGDAGEDAWEKRLCIRTTSEMAGQEWVVAEVKDNGAGMEGETAGRIFEPFFTTKEAGKGTGLGLSISYAIVESHGGKIECSSRRGVGTSFTVRFPA